MSTLTISQQKAIADYLDGRHIPAGLGSRDAACSIAAINIAITGELTDTIPPCMSKVIGHWIICVQDAMTDEMRNSAKWRSLLPLAAGTGREHEQERLTIILKWIWETVLPSVQPVADEIGFGPQWREMCVLRSAEAAARAIAAIAAITEATAAIAAGEAAEAALAAITEAAASQVSQTSQAAIEEATATIAAGEAAARAIAAIAAAAASQVSQTSQASRMETAARETARATARSKARSETWERFDPVGLLERLITCTDSHQSRK